MEQSRPVVMASKSLSKEFKQHLEHFLDFLNYQTLAAKIKTKESANESPFTTTKFSFENSKDEIKPVVTEEIKLGNGD